MRHEKYQTLFQKLIFYIIPAPTETYIIIHSFDVAGNNKIRNAEQDLRLFYMANSGQASWVH